MKKKLLKVILYLLGVILLLVGLYLFLYPVVSGYLSERNSKKAIQKFESIKEEHLKVIQTELRQEAETLELSYIKKKDELYQELENHNKNIYENGQAELKDAWSYEQAGIDLSEYGIEDNIIGVLRIPKMNDLEMPILLGATYRNMATGAVLLGETSVPIGGNHTNSVIAGHRGWNGASFFIDIEALEIGDLVYVENLWENLTYEVSEIKVILPNEISQILIQEDKELLTLITCHPYGNNSHRYVVYCSRVHNPEGEENSSITEEELESSTSSQNIGHYESSKDKIAMEKYAYIIVIVLLFLLILIVRKKSK